MECADRVKKCFINLLRDLESQVQRAESDLEAYKDSLRSKEELILKLVESENPSASKDLSLSPDGRETSAC